MSHRGRGNSNAKICILGSGPASVSARAEGVPFAGGDRHLLESSLKQSGIHPTDAYYLLAGAYDYELKTGNTVKELNEHNFDMILTLGEDAMRIVTGKRSVEKWQMSPLDTLPGIKCLRCVPTFNFRRLNAQYDHRFYFSRAVQRAAENTAPGPWVRKITHFTTRPTVDFYIEEVLAHMTDTLSVDIETSQGIINTMGLAMSPNRAIAMQCRPEDMSPEDFLRFWQFNRSLLEDPDIKKIYQNNIFETAYFNLYGITVRGLWHDTMFAQKVLYPEFKSGLANVGRLFTNEPYWKDDGTADADGGKRDWNKIADWEAHLLYNCVTKDTKVKTETGWEAIGKLVKEKRQCRVMSLNTKTRQWEYKPITNWFKNKHKEPIEWVIVYTEETAKRQRLRLTADHKVFVQGEGWTRADQLLHGDRMVVPSVELNTGALLGTLLGDSSVGITSAGRTYLQCVQKHKELVELKASLFGGTVTECMRSGGYVDSPRKMYNLYVSPNQLIANCAEVAKKPIRRLKDLKALNSLGLALWFMDDGCQQKGKSPYCKIALHAFDKQSQNVIVKWFNRRYLDSGVARIHQDNLCLPVSMSKLFCQEIGMFVPPTLRYKLPYEAPVYTPAELKQYEPKIGWTTNKITLVLKAKTKKRGYIKTSYCIEVATNHNFLTQQGVIANCKDTSGTYEAALKQRSELEARGLLEFFDRTVMALGEPVQEMCMTGLRVNEPKRLETSERVIAELAELKVTLTKPFNTRSSTQKIAHFKAKGYNIPKKRTKVGKFVESMDELSTKKLRLKYPSDTDLDVLLKMAKLENFHSSYIDFKYDRTHGTAHYGIRVTGTETLRFSSGLDPWNRGFNAQTIPKKAKGLFLPPKGTVWVNVDLEKAESFFVAYRSCDDTLMRMLKDGDDIHSYVAAAIFNVPIEQVIEEKNNGNPSKRQLGKKSGHGANYAMAANTFMGSCLKEMDLVLTKAEATNVLETYHTLFPGIRRWHGWVRDEIYNRSRLDNPHGYHRYFYGRKDDNTFREAYAWEPQSSIPVVTNEMLLGAFRNREASKLDFNMHLQCHDSLLFSATPDNAVQLMAYCQDTSRWQTPMKLPGGDLVIPVSAEYGTQLDNLKEWHGEKL